MKIRNIKILANETYKFLQWLSPLQFTSLRGNYSLRVNNVLTRRRVSSVRYGTETVSLLAPKIWDILPKDIKDYESLDFIEITLRDECSPVNLLHILRTPFLKNTSGCLLVISYLQNF